MEGDIFSDGSPTLIGLLKLIRRRRALIVTITSVSILLGCVASLLMPNIYQAKAMLVKRLDVPLEISDQMPKALSVKAYEALLKDPNMIKDIKDRLSLKDTPVERLNRNLKVNLVVEKRTPVDIVYAPLIELSAEAKNPKLAQDIVNAWADLVVEKTKELFQENASDLYRFELNRYDLTEEKLEKAEDALKDFDMKNYIRLLEKELEYKEKLLYGRPSDEKVVGWGVTVPLGYKERLNETRLLLRTGQASGSLKWRESYLTELIKDIEDQIRILGRDLVEKSLERNRYVKDVDIYRKLFTKHKKAKEIAEVIYKNQLPDIRIVSRAVLPEERIRPHRLKYLILALVIGIFSSVFLAILIEYINRLKDE